MVTLPNIDSQMIANNLKSFEPTHPGEILKDELECRSITQKQLADETGIPLSAIGDVLDCRRPLTTEYALLIAKALDLDCEPLLRMQMKYDIDITTSNNSFATRLKNIRKIAAML